MYTFIDERNPILREKLEKGTMTKDSVLDLATALIRDDIRLKPYGCCEYTAMNQLQDNHKAVPDFLKRLVIKAKSEKVEVGDN